jgi:predicted Rossmann fold flavoprotein
MSNPILVVGAGAAGLIAAWRAASLGAPVLLVERNRKPGIKLLISGGGKCNITHAGPMEELRTAFRARESRFLKPAFHRLTNGDVTGLLEEMRVPTVTRSDHRIFPRSGRADDVVEALCSLALSAGVQTTLNARVQTLHAEEGHIASAVLRGEVFPTGHVVLATGGVSYPKTGTTGDGYTWAAALGHTIVPLRPALAPIPVKPALPAGWRGVAVRGGVLSVYCAGAKRGEFRGDILFTHEGVSGPAALEVSETAARATETGEAELRLDFFPALDHPALDEELQGRILDQRDRMIRTHLETLLPNRLVPHLLSLAEVDPGKRGHVVTRTERRALVGVLKSWKLGTVGRVSIERGEVTAGGVSLDEVDPQTMRSRKVKGLYLCGEILDIAGPVGGYNLQAAFSTGFVAGETAARDWLLQQPQSNRPNATTPRMNGR